MNEHQRGRLSRPIATSLLSLAVVGCACSPTESDYFIQNPYPAVMVVRVDGGVFYRTLGPGDSMSTCLDRSRPHDISMTIPNVGLKTIHVEWDPNKNEWKSR
jgi:hypothetical protein